MAAEPDTHAEGRPPVKVVEAYRDYKPTVAVHAAAQQMIDAVPAKYLTGLRSVVLTNHSALGYDLRRRNLKSRGRKVKMDRVRGMYHPAWRGEPAWIEVFVDKTLPTSKWMRLRLLRDLVLGDVLYHELGHHVDATCRPEFREKEDVADDWRSRFLAAYLQERHKVAYPVVWLLAKAAALIGFGKKKSKR